MTEQTDPRLSAVWKDNRRLLTDVAYRMLGTVSDAEDVVQEAFTRLLRADIDTIDDVRAWLIVVVSRLCLDHLRSARVRREQYLGPWLPEPLVAMAGRQPESSANINSADFSDPAERVTLDDSVRIALLVVMEQLSPAERAAFVLHDVFNFSFDTVGTIVGRSPAACRQLASRARQHVSANVTPSRFSVEPLVHRRVADAFVAACTGGDLEALLNLLDPAVEGTADIGDLRVVFEGARAVGREIVAPRTLALFGPRSGTELRSAVVNSEAGVVATRNGTVFAVIALTVGDNGSVVEIHAIADPAKLSRVAVAPA